MANTKKQTKVSTSKEELEELSELSGEKDTRVAPAFKLPSLKLNGRDGGYYRTVLNEDGSLKQTEDGKALLLEVENPTGIILKPRKSFSYECPSYQLFTSEGSINQKAIFTVFKKQETTKGFSITMAGQGTAAELKTKFPTLKMTQVVYFMLDTKTGSELCRLKVHGMSLGPIFDYFKEFGSDEHLFQFKTVLGEKNAKNQYGKFVISTFKRGEAVKDFSEVRDNLELIKSKISEIEAYAADKNAEQMAMAEGTADLGLGEDVGKRPESSPLDKINTGKWDEEEAEELSDKVSKKRKAAKDDSDEIDVASIPFG